MESTPGYRGGCWASSCSLEPVLAHRPHRIPPRALPILHLHDEHRLDPLGWQIGSQFPQCGRGARGQERRAMSSAPRREAVSATMPRASSDRPVPTSPAYAILRRLSCCPRIRLLKRFGLARTVAIAESRPTWARRSSPAKLTNPLALCMSIGAVERGNGAVPRGSRPRPESARVTTAVNIGWH